MKKEHKYFILLWIITFTIYLIFFTTSDDDIILRIILALFFGSIISAMLFAGYDSTRKKKIK